MIAETVNNRHVMAMNCNWSAMDAYDRAMFVGRLIHRLETDGATRPWSVEILPPLDFTTLVRVTGRVGEAI